LVDTEVDLKTLSERCGVAKSKPLRLTTYEVMSAVLKVAPGSVTPFAVINTDRSVRLLLDARFKDCERLLFHPLTNDATTLITPAGLVAFLASLGRTPEWVDFSLPGDAAIPPADA
jgi:Ala-tRNA(Pro) deacylase